MAVTYILFFFQALFSESTVGSLGHPMTIAAENNNLVVVVVAVYNEKPWIMVW